MTTIVHGGPGDVIAYAWYQIGYRPRESLVLVGLTGRPRRTGPVLRCDLPPSRGCVDRLGAALVDPLRRCDVRAVVVLLVTDRGGDGAPRLGQVVTGLLGAAGMDVLDVLLVGDRSYRSLTGSGDVGQDSAGSRGEVSLREVECSAVAAHMVAVGRVLAAREDDLVADVDPVPATDGPAVGDGDRASSATWLRRWREAVSGPVPDQGPRRRSHQGLGRELGPAMADPRLRDAILVSLLPGAGRFPEDLLSGIPVDLDAVMDRRPDEELMDRGCALLADVARRAAAGHRADALAVLAWAAWWRGEGTRARLLVARALDDHAGHRLAALVGRLLQEGVPPSWNHPAGPTVEDSRCTGDGR
jgi:hypothetical protein